MKHTIENDPAIKALALVQMWRERYEKLEKEHKQMYEALKWAINEVEKCWIENDICLEGHKTDPCINTNFKNAKSLLKEIES